jgi:hypothetical protein
MRGNERTRIRLFFVRAILLDAFQNIMSVRLKLLAFPSTCAFAVSR